jgi:hypothetical protein
VPRTTLGSRLTCLARRPALAAAPALAAVLLLPLAGCSYLKWRQTRAEGLRALKTHPDLTLEADILPESCFVLTGRIESGDQPPGPLLVAAFEHDGPAR